MGKYTGAIPRLDELNVRLITGHLPPNVFRIRIELLADLPNGGVVIAGGDIDIDTALPARQYAAQVSRCIDLLRQSWESKTEQPGGFWDDIEREALSKIPQ